MPVPSDVTENLFWQAAGPLANDDERRWSFSRA